MLLLGNVQLVEMLHHGNNSETTLTMLHLLPQLVEQQVLHGHSSKAITTVVITVTMINTLLMEVTTDMVMILLRQLVEQILGL